MRLYIRVCVRLYFAFKSNCVCIIRRKSQFFVVKLEIEIGFIYFRVCRIHRRRQCHCRRGGLSQSFITPSTASGSRLCVHRHRHHIILLYSLYDIILYYYYCAKSSDWQTVTLAVPKTLNTSYYYTIY